MRAAIRTVSVPAMCPIEESDTSTRGHSCDEYPPNDPAIRRYLAGQSQPSKLTVAASGPPVVDVSGRPAAAGSHSDSQERGLSRAGSNIHGYRAPADQHTRNRAAIPNKPTSSFHPQATHSDQHAASREPFWEPTMARCRPGGRPLTTARPTSASTRVGAPQRTPTTGAWPPTDQIRARGRWLETTDVDGATVPRSPKAAVRCSVCPPQPWLPGC